MLHVKVHYCMTEVSDNMAAKDCLVRETCFCTLFKLRLSGLYSRSLALPLKIKHSYLLSKPCFLSVCAGLCKNVCLLSCMYVCVCLIKYLLFLLFYEYCYPLLVMI